MREFEKWWQKHRASSSPHTCQSARGENLMRRADAEIWKAALKWTIDSMLSFPVSGHRSSHDRSNMIARIKKESEK